MDPAIAEQLVAQARDEGADLVGPGGLLGDIAWTSTPTDAKGRGAHAGLPRLAVTSHVRGISARKH